MSAFTDFPPEKKQELKVLTYNVHSCIGTDRRVDPERIAEVIAQSGADIIALQELDVGRSRTGGVDQAHMIASLLKMEAHFHPALHVEEEQYGDAILTAFPTQLMKAGPLPSIGETRGAIWVRIDIAGRSFNVLNTHLGLSNRDRVRQVEMLLGPQWIADSAFQGAPSVICGDFNAIPASRAYKMMAKGFTDAQHVISAKPRPTFPSRFPMLRIDHMFVSKELEATSATVIANPLTRRASDHLPLLTSIRTTHP
jgi:endonuclease/exonuclease/phosphatase family metal-dependent hydrolase